MRAHGGDWFAIGITLIVLAVLDLRILTRVRTEPPVTTPPPQFVPDPGAVEAFEPQPPFELRTDLERLVWAAITKPTGLTRDVFQFVESSAGFFHSLPSYVGPGFSGREFGNHEELEVIARGPKALPVLLRLARECGGECGDALPVTEWTSFTRRFSVGSFPLEDLNALARDDVLVPDFPAEVRLSLAARALELAGHIANRPFVTHWYQKFNGKVISRFVVDDSWAPTDLRASLLEDLDRRDVSSSIRRGALVRLRRYYPEELDGITAPESTDLRNDLLQLSGSLADDAILGRAFEEGLTVVDVRELLSGAQLVRLQDPEDYREGYRRIQRSTLRGYSAEAVDPAGAFHHWRWIAKTSDQLELPLAGWLDAPRADVGPDELSAMLWFCREELSAATWERFAQDDRELEWFPDVLAYHAGEDFEGLTVRALVAFAR